MSITIEQVKAALSHVQDPDLGRDLVSLGMIDKLTVDGNKIRFDIVLTTPACPMKERMRCDCLAAIAQYVSPEAEVEIGFSARMRAPETREHEALKDVKHIIAVGSGKGGVGKSTVSANLALALAKTGAKVALVDADIYGPSVPTMFGLTHTAPKGVEADGKTYLVPMEQYGLKIMSIGFFVDPAKAVLWRGPMASNALRQMFTETLWGEIDYMVVDLPPGTGDIQITLSQMIPVTAALLVSTPQEVAVADVRKAADMFREVKTPVLGVVENMAYFTPAELPDNKYYIFGKGGCERLAQEFGFPLLAQIPLVASVCEQADLGKPVMQTPDSPATDPVKAVFTALGGEVARQLAVLEHTK
ncbi:MAG: Mrp/NBP35 family ATP-binding protein [Bacteroidales bacterium]|nr:Mrp/NBP35 family ATP-binding protein [Bacteroidales bacterium]